MPIAVTCTCGTNLEADDGPGPQTLKCPQCRRGIALFVAAPPRIEAPVFNQVQYHRRAWIGEDGLLGALCPECDFRIKAPPNLAGKQGRCPQCGTDVLLPRIDLPGLDPDNLPPAIPADPIEAEPAKAKASSPKGPSPEEQVEAAMQEAQPDRSHEDFDDVDKLVQQIAAPEVAPTEPGKEVGRIGEDGLIRTLCIECGYRIKGAAFARR